MVIYRLFRNLFYSIFKGKQESLSVYNSIEDLPMWNWNKIHETKNLNYLLKKKDYKNLPNIFKKTLVDNWLDLNQQVFDEFGMSDKYEQYIRLTKLQIQLRCEKVIQEDRFLINEVNVLQVDIDALFSDKENQSFDQVMVGLEKYLGFRLDSKKITVRKYNDYLKFINSQSKGNGKD